MVSYSQNIVPEVQYAQRDTHPQLGFIGNGASSIYYHRITVAGSLYRASIRPSLPEFIGYNFKTTTPTVAKYGIIVGGQYHDMTSWDLQGSNNNGSWTVLHSVQGVKLNSGTLYEWEINNKTAYKYYRLYVRARTGTNSWGLNRFLLYEEVNDPPTTPGPFTVQPLVGSVNLSGESVGVEWGHSTDSEGDSIRYNLEFYNGSSWSVIASDLISTAYSYTLPSLNVTNAQFRVRAVDDESVGSGYRVSNVFQVYKRLILIEDKDNLKTFKDDSWINI